MPPPRNGTLLLSPHADDAALALGGSVARRLLPTPITLLTVFGRSCFTQAAGPDSDVDDVSRLRFAEDASYADHHQLAHRWLGLDEALLRLGPEQILVPAGSPLQPLPEADALAVRAAIGDTHAALVLAPLGLGSHADHLLLQCLAAAAAGDTTVAFYEDLPYAARMSNGSITAHARAVDPRLTRVDLPIGADGLTAKLADLDRHYPSQIAPWIRKAVRRHGRDGTESIWVRAADRALLAVG